jgi:hypothetical protein
MQRLFQSKMVTTKCLISIKQTKYLKIINYVIDLNLICMPH